MISKIELKENDGTPIFVYEVEDNTIKKTVEAYIKKERASGVERPNLNSVNLEGADLTWVDLSLTDLTYANLTEANLVFAQLYGADLHCADLHGADLNNTNLGYTRLKWANLSGASLIGTNLSYSNLIGADLRNANLCNADLKFADLENADLRVANLIGAELTSIKNLKYAYFNISTNEKYKCELLAIKTFGEIIIYYGIFNGSKENFLKYIKTDDNLRDYTEEFLEKIIDGLISLIERQKVN